LRLFFEIPRTGGSLERSIMGEFIIEGGWSIVIIKGNENFFTKGRSPSRAHYLAL
jgi:hypothetical protein